MHSLFRNTSFLHSLAADGNKLPADVAPPSLLPPSYCALNAVACADIIAMAHGGAPAGPHADGYAATRRALHGVGADGAPAPSALHSGNTLSVTAALATFWQGRSNLDPVVFERDCGGCPFVGARARAGMRPGDEVPQYHRVHPAAVPAPAGPPPLAVRPQSLATVSPFPGSDADSVGVQACVRACSSQPTSGQFASCHKSCTGQTPAETCVFGCDAACAAMGRSRGDCGCEALCKTHRAIDKALTNGPIPLSQAWLPKDQQQ
jgi:hypothetical protein